MKVRLISWGKKHGPLDAQPFGKIDLVADVSTQMNPYSVASLRNLTGKDEPVRRWLDKSVKWHQKFREIHKDVMDLYMRQEGQGTVNVAVNCFGGKHRSVAMVLLLKDNLGVTFDDIQVVHRELD